MIPGALGFPRYGSSATPFGGLGSLRDSPLNPADPFGALTRPGFPPTSAAGMWPLKVRIYIILFGFILKFNYFQGKLQIQGGPNWILHRKLKCCICCLRDESDDILR